MNLGNFYATGGEAKLSLRRCFQLRWEVAETGGIGGWFGKRCGSYSSFDARDQEIILTRGANGTSE
jgi:hypothetical protein